jgi:hypothetical protein
MMSLFTLAWHRPRQLERITQTPHANPLVARGAMGEER